MRGIPARFHTKWGSQGGVGWKTHGSKSRPTTQKQVIMRGIPTSFHTKGMFWKGLHFGHYAWNLGPKKGDFAKDDYFSDSLGKLNQRFPTPAACSDTVRLGPRQVCMNCVSPTTTKADRVGSRATCGPHHRLLLSNGAPPTEVDVCVGSRALLLNALQE